ncbi:uncharacterized protein LOC108673083 [Hyalella azteca]|uniref:Uncharacterized protein LOC108673083 n=1 Tax=Hyalella azteca TaxID=294128 RepID=A0A8B7NRP0_HYAAZ|nr:uncharacterized protein LOC108673083 [Hyalella azteca]
MNKILLFLAIAAALCCDLWPAMADDVGDTTPEGDGQVGVRNETSAPKASIQEDSEILQRELDVSSDDPEDQKRNAKFFAFYTSKTKAVIVTGTVFALSTCFSTTNTPSCAGRRKRNVFSDKMNPFLSDDNGNAISSSLGDPDFEINSGAARPTGKKFTIWSTLFSTYTVITTSYYAGTTVTVSALCNPGFAASCFG